MEIRHYTTATIIDFVNSAQFRKIRNIPITTIRAISHNHNPRASADDRILFVAWDHDEVIGYLGVVADKLIQNGSFVRIGWLSCFWVDPAFRGKNVSVDLFLKVMET